MPRTPPPQAVTSQMSPNLPNVSWKENSPLVENCYPTFSDSTPRYLWQKTHTFVLGSMHINQSSIVIKQKKIVIILENM